MNPRQVFSGQELTDEPPQIHFHHYYIHLGMSLLELSVSRFMNLCTVTGTLSRPFLENSIYGPGGFVTAHLPLVGYTKYATISKKGFFYLSLETPGGYVFTFDLCEGRSSVLIDLENQGLPTLLFGC